ncbi:MAG TPA: DMT family transporter [Pseudonocardiaceae bacterium]|nr:DMT family transporter [Pseudonocardiaceae bacterium]
MPFRTVGLIAALALIWGSGFFWIRLSLDGFSPVQLTFARLALGALVLAIVVTARRLRWPRGKRVWGHLTVAALISNAIPYGLFAYAEQSVPSSLAGSLNATTPLWTAVIAFCVGADRPMGARRIVGLLVGFAGAVVLLSPWNSDHPGTVPGTLACIGASISYGLSYVYQARYLTNRGLSPLVLAAGQLAASTVILAIPLAIAGDQSIHLTVVPVMALLILGVLGTGLAYVINFALIASEGATGASVVTYLVPVTAALLGVAILGEPWTLLSAAGLVAILAGVYMARRRPRIR